MAGKWDVRPLSELLEQVIDHRGKTPIKLGANFSRTGYPVLSARHVKTDQLIRLDEVRYVSSDTYRRWMREPLRGGDIILTSEAPLGEVYLLNNETEYVLGQRLFALRVNRSLIEPEYLAAWLASPKGQAALQQRATGTTAQGIRQSQLVKILVDVPDRAVQQSLGTFRNTVAQAIALNGSSNQTLEQLTQAIFQAWFVDFQPVRAKAAARAAGRDPLRAAMCALSGKDEAALNAMPREHYEQLATTAALFPDELVDSEIGEVPLGWLIQSLPEVLEINPPRPLKKGTAAPYVEMASVPSNSSRVAHVAVRAFGSGSKFRNGDTLLARITPCLENGKTAFVDFLEPGEVGWGSTEFIVLRPKPPLPEPFAYFLCRDPGFRSFAIANMAGTTGRQRVPNDCFANYHIAVPDAETAQAFGRFATGCLNLMRARDAESQTLAELRDTLLPKLLSGEIGVGEVRELVEAAA